MDISKELIQKHTQLKTTEDNLKKTQESCDSLKLNLDEMKPKVESIKVKKKELEKSEKSKGKLEDELLRLQSFENPDDVKAAQKQIDDCKSDLKKAIKELNALNSEIATLESECNDYEQLCINFDDEEKKVAGFYTAMESLNEEIKQLENAKAAEEAKAATVAQKAALTLVKPSATQYRGMTITPKESDTPNHKYISPEQCEYVDPQTGEMSDLNAGQMMYHWSFGPVSVIDFEKRELNVVAHVRILKPEGITWHDLLVPLPDGTGRIRMDFLYANKEEVIVIAPYLKHRDI